MKTKRIFIVLAVVYFISGCSLDEKIYDTVIVDKIESKDDVELLINGIFQSLEIDYKNSMALFFEWGGGTYASTWSLGQAFVNRSVTSGDSYVNHVWRQHYIAIVNINSLLEQLESDEALTTEYREQVTGEMYFLRALAYLDLVRLFGGVPLRLETTTGTSDLYLSRSSVDDIYAVIFGDLNSASELCLPFSEQPNDEFGRPTKGAAQSLLALAYLTYANHCDLNGKSSDSPQYYQLAKEFADAVIISNEYSLVENYADLWDVNNETKTGSYREVIFGIQFTRDALTSGQSSKGSMSPYYTQPSSRYHVCGNNPNGQGAGVVQIQPWFYDKCSTGDYVNDYRTEVSFLTRWPYAATANIGIAYPALKQGTEKVSVPSPFCPYMNKYTDANGLDNRNHENDHYVIRLSEVYLIKAEAENELNGPTATAYGAFNKLRERARWADGTTRITPEDLETGLSKEEFRMKIYDERGLEFVGETKRVFDDVRMRYLDNTRPMVQYRYEDFFPGMSADQKVLPKYNASTNTWGPGRLQPTNLIPYSEKLLLWPIPSTEDANPNMTQNPGW